MNDLDKPFIVTLAEEALPYTIHESLWISCSAKLVTVGSVTNESGIIEIYEIDDGIFSSRKKICTEKSLRCGTFGASSLRDRHLATGDFCGNLQIWDIEHSMNALYSVQAHDKIISTIDGVAGDSIGCGAPEIVTGSFDGFIKVWDPRQKDKPVVVMAPSDNNFRACWAVAVGNSYNSQERVICSGFDNGDMRMFDLRAMKVRWETTVNNGVCSIEFDKKTTEIDKFVAVGLEGMICLFDNKNRHNENFIKVEQQAHYSTVWCVRFLPQNRDLFVTCGGSGSICLWKYHCFFHGDTDKSLDQIQKTNISSSQPINSFSWSPDKNGLAVCSSFDQTVRLLYFSKLNLL